MDHLWIGDRLQLLEVEVIGLLQQFKDPYCPLDSLDGHDQKTVREFINHEQLHYGIVHDRLGVEEVVLGLQLELRIIMELEKIDDLFEYIQVLVINVTGSQSY